MNNFILDEKKIDTLVSSYQDTERLIYTGSDEHLDLIIALQNNIRKLVKLSEDVNEELEKSFNDLTEEQAKSVVIKLTSGLRYARQLITILRKLHPSLSNGIRSLRKELYIETKQIDEFVQDLIKYKINNPQELTDLLNNVK